MEPARKDKIYDNIYARPFYKNSDSKVTQMKPKHIIAGTAWLALFAIQINTLTAQQSSGLSVAEQEKKMASEFDSIPDSTWETIEAIFEVLADHRFEPITKQEVVLKAAWIYSEFAGQPMSRDECYEISNLTSEEELRDWMNHYWNLLPRRSEFTVAQLNAATGRDLLNHFEPSAQFVSAKEFVVRQQLKENQYVGIGIRLSQDGEYAMIDDPFPGGAARMAGARKGDLIIKIDGNKTDGMTLREVVDTLRGPKGSELTATVKNVDGSEPRLLEMVRDVIPIASIEGHKQRDDGEWVYRTDESPDIAFLRFANVVGSTSAELQEISRKLNGEDVQGIVLDFRRINDGDLHHTQMLADVLLGKTELGTVRFVSEPTRGISTREEHAFADMPITVLTPRHVSGPIFALLASLQDRPNTQLIGPETQSHRYCLSSFALRDRLGGIERVRSARFEPFNRNRNDADHTPESEAESKRMSVLMPDVNLSDDSAVIKKAMSWLTSQSG